MKIWYNRKTRERSFKAGDKVLALLPIPGHSLQARYHGPYVVECKVNDVDYVVVTPDRRKQRQLCHINMLKEYHDEEELCTVAVTTLVDKGQRKLDVEKEGQHSEYIDDNGVRLNNSAALANLKSKLGHLPENESSELECLILEYTQLFPDTPTQTKVMCHDMNVGSAEPIKQHAYRVNPQ